MVQGMTVGVYSSLNRTNFGAEIEVDGTWNLLAILKYPHNCRNIVILTDSKAAMQAFSL